MQTVPFLDRLIADYVTVVLMTYRSLCNFMPFLNDKCGHGVGAEYMVDPQNN